MEGVRIVTGFISAYNRGDQEALRGYFSAEAAGRGNQAEPGQFGWFAVTGEEGGINPGAGAYSRDELLPYLAERHAHHERLRLLQIDVGRSWRPHGLEILFDVDRRADDIPTHTAGGKGSLDCATGTIIVWNLGDREVLPAF